MKFFTRSTIILASVLAVGCSSAPESPAQPQKANAPVADAPSAADDGATEPANDIATEPADAENISDADAPVVPINDIDDTDMPFADIDSRESADSYGVEVKITGDGYYTFNATGEDKATWSIYAVTAKELAEDGGPCRLIAQGCDELPKNTPVPIQKGSLVCAIPSVNAFTINDRSDLLQVGESMLKITRKGAVLKSGAGCHYNP